MTEPYTFSYSEVQDLRQCPYKWQLGWEERWTAPGASPALERGRRWHTLLSAFYGHRKQRVGPRKAYRLTREEHLGDDGTEETTLLAWMLQGYVEHWGGDPEWEITGVEFKEVVPAWERFHLKIRADLVVRLRGDPAKRLWLVDHKSTRNLSSEEELQLHAEFCLYTWALRRQGIPIWGAIHSSARTQMNKDPSKQALEDRFRRTLIYHPPQHLEVVALDAWRDMHNQLQGRRYDTDLSAPGLRRPDLPRHIDPERCRFRCSFTEACIAGMRGGDTRAFLRDLGYTQDQTRH